MMRFERRGSTVVVACVLLSTVVAVALLHPWGWHVCAEGSNAARRALPMRPAQRRLMAQAPARGGYDIPASEQTTPRAPASSPTKPASPAHPTPQVSPTPPEKELPFYGAYLKKPDSLGFAPDEALFDEVYRQVKSEHVDDDPDIKLYEGVAKEVGALLKEAHADTEALDAMPRDKDLPTAILRAYGEKVNLNLLWYAMIRGLLEGTDDPYSVLMTPKEYDVLREEMQSKAFGGIGIYIELDHANKNQLTVMEPLEGTPAAHAGLMAGDQIVKINGKSTAGMTIDLATAAIRGQIGTTVVITVHRPGGSGTRDFAIERAAIEVPSVSRRMLPGNIGYIRLRMFGSRTGQELDDALDFLHKNGSRALILDLRNNGGGLITSAVDVCSHFIQAGALVTYTIDKRHTRRDYSGEARPRTKLPMLLLVNQFSASASEITAGCFKDYGTATLIGVKTFGKGSVQQLYDLPDGAALKLTIAHFFTPKGNRINKVGVQPDIKIEMEPRLVGASTDKDVQLQKAIDFLKTRGIIQGSGLGGQGSGMLKREVSAHP